jgi:peroxiredoxin
MQTEGSRGVFRRQFAAMVIVLAIVLLSLQLLANTVPLADFEVWRSAADELAVTFDASSSSDPDGNVESYQWTFGDGTSGSGVERTHQYPYIDSYSVTLLVKDNGGTTGRVTKTIDLRTLPIAGSSDGVAIGSEVGQRAPEFALPDLEDKIVRLSDFLDRTTLLVFWSSWCGACKTSLPYVESLRREFESHGLVVMLILLDPGSPSNARSFLSKNGYSGFVIVRETDSDEQPTVHAYDVTSKPHTVLVDEHGIIRYTGHPNGLSEQLIAVWL